MGKREERRLSSGRGTSEFVISEVEQFQAMTGFGVWPWDKGWILVKEPRRQVLEAGEPKSSLVRVEP